MLDPDRQNYLTASVAHTAMSDWELELQGLSMEKPSCATDEVITHIKDGLGVRVGDFKSAGIVITGAEIKDAVRYVKATTPIFSPGMETASELIAMRAFINERDPGITTLAMQHGIDTELEAVTALEHKLGLNFTNTGEDQQFLSSGFLGVSPDAIEYDSFDIKSCAEIKCPVDKTHMRYLHRIKSQEDLLKEEPKYYWQCMCGLSVTGAESYHFSSFHSGFHDKYKLVYCEVTPNLQHIDILKRRAERIAKKVPEIIEDIKLRY